MRDVVLWDFDGTLAWRPGKWRSALMAALDQHEPGHGVAPDAILPFLRDGFPWHRPEQPHPELSTPAAWWAEIGRLLESVYRGVGYAEAPATALARRAREIYLDPAGFHLFDDTLAALDRLTARGWRHVVLSNHVPELADLVAGVGLAGRIDAVVTSARIGFEKPHPEAFEAALRVAGEPERVVMVGDNAVADVQGAEAVGIPGILVHANHGDGAPATPTLLDAVAAIEREHAS